MTETCVRCAAPAGAVMTFSYSERTVWLEDLTRPADPGDYPMCSGHAGRMSPPVGWTLVDRRSETRPLFVSLEVA